MGRYMSVVLKEQHKTEEFIEKLNQTLFDSFGANNGSPFPTRKYVQEEADFMNSDPEGLKQFPEWDRPISADRLIKNFFGFRIGEFHYKISSAGEAKRARSAIAICKWIIQTNSKFIDIEMSENYSRSILEEYLNHVFQEEGYDLKKLWK